MTPERETSPATTQLVLAYLLTELGESAVRDVVTAADLPFSLQELRESSSAWISYDARLRLFEQATLALGRPEALLSVGASAVRSRLHPALVALMRALGSPRAAYRQLSRVVGKFSAVSSMTVADVSGTGATVRYAVQEGCRPSRLECLYVEGLLSVIPEIFGRPSARVVHEQCQADGASACLYRVSWARRRLRRKGSAPDPELAVLREQVDALHSIASDLVSDDRLEDVLQRITDRAASAVLAPGYLLAVSSPHDGSPLVFSCGMAGDEQAQLAQRLLHREDLGPGTLVVDVASTRRHHGRLAALNAEGHVGVGDERRMLTLYAEHAAVALDLLAALEGRRNGEERATALLGLSHRLATADGTAAVADVVAAALPGIVGSESAAVFLWDGVAGELRAAAVEGLEPALEAALLATPILPEDHPELVDMLARRQPRAIHRATAEPMLAALLELLGVSTLLVVPLTAGTDLLGIATASWSRGGQSAGALVESLDRLAGVAEQAATALSNARLVETMKHQSEHDDLTGLPNRVLFHDRLDAALRSCPRGTGVAVLFCDLDRFKEVNDVLGHAGGDELLRQVADRLRDCLRPGDSVGRLSGDEFAVLLTGVSALPDAEDVARRIVACFDPTFRIDGRGLRVTTSVGVALHNGPEGRGDRLLRAADGAMYRAKQRGRNQICCADDEPLLCPTGPSLEQELVEAVTGNDLRLHFQPIVRVGGELPEVVGVEALLRWEHPRLGLLPPGAFLPLAEESSLVVELDLWAVRATCAAAAQHRSAPGSPPLQFSVNLAGRTLVDARLVQAVRSALADHSMDPARLCLEVVESQSLVDLPTVAARLTELRRMGVRTALDDFGTGYSTLSWLQRLPVDRIKLDRTFITGLPEAPAQLLVRGVVALAGQLGIEVVAEGVETPEQLTALVEAGCGLMQGYLLGRPEPALPELLSSVTAVASG